MTENIIDNNCFLEKLSLSNNSELNIESSNLLNIAIGSKIRLVDSNTKYIFYGYNHNQTLISCFPENSKNAVDNMIYVPLQQLETILYTTIPDK